MVEHEMPRILPQYAEDVRIPNTKRNPQGHFRISQPPVFTEHLSFFTPFTSTRFQTVATSTFTTTIASSLVVCRDNAIEFKGEETSEDDETVNERVEGTARLDGYRSLVLNRRSSSSGTASSRFLRPTLTSYSVFFMLQPFITDKLPKKLV